MIQLFLSTSLSFHGHPPTFQRNTVNPLQGQNESPPAHNHIPCCSSQYRQYSNMCGTRWCSWLRHCVTIRKVAGSIPYGVIGIFHWHNPSSRSMALGSTQSLTEMSTRNISWGGSKGGRCVGLTTLPPSCADCLEIWEPQPPGTLWACPGP